MGVEFPTPRYYSADPPRLRDGGVPGWCAIRERRRAGLCGREGGEPEAEGNDDGEPTGNRVALASKEDAVAEARDRQDGALGVSELGESAVHKLVQ